MEKIFDQVSVIENDYVKKWKAEGGKILGYGCVATPLEILEAGKVLPYRIRGAGKSDTDLADAHLSRFNCSFCRSCLQLGLDGTYDFLDGLIETNGCDHLRGMFENWRYQKNPEFFHYLKVPHLVYDETIEYFAQEISFMKNAVEELAQKKITDDDLWRSIKEYEKLRRNLKSFYKMRERDKPAFTGAEAMTVFLKGSSMTAADFSITLERLMEEREGRQIEGYKSRLLLFGAATDEVDFVNAIESQGGLLVGDGLCFGHRAFWPVSKAGQGDPCRALSGMYLNNLLCPRMFDDYQSRKDYAFESMKRTGAHGVIVVHNKFCDIHGVDNVQLRMDLEEQGVPVLQLEKEYGAKADEGRMKTRIQAFLERIGEK